MAAPTPQAVGTPVADSAAISVPWPAHQANDIGLLFVNTRGHQPLTTTPAGWTDLPSSPQQSQTEVLADDVSLAGFWRRAAGSSESDAAVADTGDYQHGLIVTFRGCVTTGDPWDIERGESNPSNTTSFSFSGDSTNISDTLVVVAVGVGDDATLSGWANASLAGVAEMAESTSTVSTDSGITVATGTKATAGVFGATIATISEAEEWGALLLALKAEGAGSGEYGRSLEWGTGYRRSVKVIR